MLLLARISKLGLRLDIILVIQQALNQLDGIVDLSLDGVDDVLGGSLGNRSLGSLGGRGSGLGNDRLGLGDAVDANQLRLEDCKMGGLVWQRTGRRALLRNVLSVEPAGMEPMARWP